MSLNEYAPGICNIGADEIRRRRLLGWIGLAATATLWLTLILVDASPATYLLVFLPALGSAIGFVQATLRFCVLFGFLATFNFDKPGRMEKVTSPEAQREDRAQAYRVLAASLTAAVTVTLIAFGSALVFG